MLTGYVEQLHDKCGVYLPLVPGEREEHEGVRVECVSNVASKGAEDVATEAALSVSDGKGDTLRSVRSSCGLVGWLVGVGFVFQCVFLCRLFFFCLSRD